MKREFSTGATRDTEQGKLDYEGFLSPKVLRRYAQYLNKHRTMRDGSTRDSDNWQKGIPKDVYMKSLLRHTMDVWEWHRHGRVAPGGAFHDALCAVMFNAMGYLFEELRDEGPQEGSQKAEATYTILPRRERWQDQLGSWSIPKEAAEDGHSEEGREAEDASLWHLRYTDGESAVRSLPEEPF